MGEGDGAVVGAHRGAEAGGGPSAALQPPPPAPEPRLGRPAVPEEGDSGVNEVHPGECGGFPLGQG